MRYTSTFIYLELTSCPADVKDKLINALTVDEKVITKYKVQVYRDKKGDVGAINALLPNHKLVSLLKSHTWTPLKSLSIKLI